MLAKRPLLTQSVTTAVRRCLLINQTPLRALNPDGFSSVGVVRNGRRHGPARGRKSWRGEAQLCPNRPHGSLRWRYVPSAKLEHTNTNLTSLLEKAVFGPAATTWFAFLQRRINLRSPNATIAARVLTDQCVFASTNLFVFLSSMAIMEGTSPMEKLESTYTTALAKNWILWPAVQAMNFKFVPLQHRVLVVNIVSLGRFLTLFHDLGEDRSHTLTWRAGWNCYLSYVNSQGK